MINLDTSKILLVGQGEKLDARAAKLKELDVKNLTMLHAPCSMPQFPDYDVVMVVGLSEEDSAQIYKAAKAARCLVNVEDNKKYCDFFFQSFVRRGKLLISVSTNGSSPGTAKIVRDKINEIFPPQWAEYIDEIEKKRREWRGQGLTYEQVNDKTSEFVKKWLV